MNALGYAYLAKAIVILVFLVGCAHAHGGAFGQRNSVREARDREQRRCMVYLPDIRDVKLRAWCVKQSERMP